MGQSRRDVRAASVRRHGTDGLPRRRLDYCMLGVTEKKPMKNAFICMTERDTTAKAKIKN